VRVVWHVWPDQTGRSVIWWVYDWHHGRPLVCTKATLCTTLAELTRDLADLEAELWSEQAERLVGR